MSLALSGNSIGGAGAVAIAECLPKGLRQLTLDLMYCNIGEAGAVAIANRIPEGLTHPTLRFGSLEP